MPKHDPFSRTPTSPPGRSFPRVIGAIALAALLAAQLRQSSSEPRRPRSLRPDWPPSPPSRGPLRRGGGAYPVPEPVRPDRPLPLHDGAAAELSFDD